MFLPLQQADIPMRLVFELAKELRKNPKRIEITQALTLNSSKPTMGLKGALGLFGSEDWWNSIAARKMPLLFLSGIIKRAYVAGPDDGEIDTIDMLLDDGAVRSVGIYVNDNDDLRLFCPGHRAEIVYALDELKQRALDGSVNHSKVALEMAVSTRPVAQLS